MLDLDELERLEQAATDGPWYSHVEMQDGRNEYDPGLEWLELSIYPDAGDEGFAFSSSRECVPSEDEANFDLIVALRNNAAALIARARRADELEQAQRWIPVSERLPDSLDVVTICLYNGNRMSSTYNTANGFWYINNGSILRTEVTHWMPLPAPPA